MQINTVKNIQITQINQNFKGTSANSDVLPDKKEDKPLTFFEKLKYYPSLRIFPIVLPEAYGIYKLAKGHSLKKKVQNSPQLADKLKEFKKSSTKKLLAFCALAVPVYFLTDYMNKKNADRNFAKAQEQVDYFNKHNGTNIKISARNSSERKSMASFSPLSGEILLSKNVVGDILNSKFEQINTLNHELKHAKQYILMASSKDGINKLNYSIIQKMAQNSDDKYKKELYKAYNEIKTNNFIDDKSSIVIRDYKIKYNDFVIAMYKSIYQNDVNPENFPIIINKEFYEMAKKAKGQLTQEEENKANQYFKAYEKYSLDESYRENLLEKEAFNTSNIKYLS